MQTKFATPIAVALLSIGLSACGSTPEQASAKPAEPVKSAKPAKPALSPEASAALAAAEADVKKAKAEFALWTTAESAFKAAQESAKTGDSEAVIKQAKKASALVELGLKQKSYASTEMK